MKLLKILFKSRKISFFPFVLTIFIFNFNSKADDSTLFISPQEVNFGEVTVGIEKKIKILITNTKNEPIQIQEIKLSNSENFWINENGGETPCGNNRILNFKEKCTMEIAFIPFEEKKYSSEIKFYTSDNEKTKLKLIGKGIQNNDPKLEIDFGEIDKKEYNFGYVFIGDTAPKMFTIRNNGKGFLVFKKKIRVSNEEQFEVDPNSGTNPCGTFQPILAKGQSCTFMVYFRPDKEKKYETKLKLNTNDPEDEEVVIKLRGRGTSNPIPKIEVEKARETFVDTQIGKESNLMIKISNKGNGILDIIKMELSNNENFRIDVNSGIKPCNSLTPSIFPNEFCTVYIKFRPDRDKTYKTTLTILSTDVEHKKVKISLKGKGKHNISETSNSESLSSSSAGCNFGMPTIPMYLLIPLLFLIRKFKRK